MMMMTVVVVVVVVVVSINTVNLDLLQHVIEAQTFCRMKSDVISVVVVTTISRHCVVDSTAVDVDGNQTPGDVVPVIVLK